MRATFGMSTVLAVQEFKLMVSLNMIVSYYPQQYGDVEAPFVLPPIQLNGGAGTNTAFIGNFEMSMATQGVAVTPRDVLGNHPRVVISYDGGKVSYRFVQWSDSNRFLWRVDSLSSSPSVVKILSILDSNGVERWRNPADIVSV